MKRWSLLPLLGLIFVRPLCVLAAPTGAILAPQEKARQLIDAHAYDSTQTEKYAQGVELLKELTQSDNAQVADFQLLARAMFTRNEQVSLTRNEEDITEALNILSLGKAKFGPQVALSFDSFFYSFFSKDERRKENWLKEIANLLPAPKHSSPLAEDQIALYYLAAGSPSEAKIHFENYVKKAQLTPVQKTRFYDRYGSMLLALADATLARECVETYERAITERPEIPLYYARAGHCAQRGIDFERAHAFFKNAYELQSANPDYRKAFTDSLLVQLAMNRETWTGSQQLQVVAQIYELAPTKENLLTLLGISLEHEALEKQIELIQKGEAHFQSEPYAYFLYLFKGLKSESAEGSKLSQVRQHLLKRIIAAAPSAKHRAYYAYLAFLEQLNYQDKISYRKALYAEAFLLAKEAYGAEESDELAASLLSSLYLFQFLQTEDFNKLALAEGALKNVAQKSTNVIYLHTRELLDKINSKTEYKGQGLLFRLKEVAARMLTNLDISLFDFAVQRQMYSSLQYKEQVDSFQFYEDILRERQ